MYICAHYEGEHTSSSIKFLQLKYIDVQYFMYFLHHYMTKLYVIM